MNFASSFKIKVDPTFQQQVDTSLSTVDLGFGIPTSSLAHSVSPPVKKLWDYCLINIGSFKTMAVPLFQIQGDSDHSILVYILQICLINLADSWEFLKNGHTSQRGNILTVYCVTSALLGQTLDVESLKNLKQTHNLQKC